MAVYNGERYLRESIESVLSQTCEDFEFLIIDDGSTDSTRKIILSYADRRIRLIENERNIGLTRSLNRGLRAARGEFIARQDADDISEPQRFERQIDFLERHPDVAVLGTWYTEIDGDGVRGMQRELPWEYTAIRWSFYFFNPFVHSAVVFRRRLVLDRLGMFDESLPFAQDHEYWWRIARHLPVANLPEFLMRFRIHAGSLTAAQGKSEDVGYRLRVNAVAHLLGWKESSPNSIERRYDAMSALWRGKDGEQTAASILAAVDDVLHLHSAFTQGHRLSLAEHRAHRAAVLRRIGWRVFGLAQRSSENGDIHGAWRLILRACQLHPQLLRHPQTLRFSGRILLQSRLLRKWSWRLSRLRGK